MGAIGLALIIILGLIILGFILVIILKKRAES